jgi:hypothetical protein
MREREAFEGSARGRNEMSGAWHAARAAGLGVGWDWDYLVGIGIIADWD